MSFLDIDKSMRVTKSSPSHHPIFPSLYPLDTFPSPVFLTPFPSLLPFASLSLRLPFQSLFTLPSNQPFSPHFFHSRVLFPLSPQPSYLSHSLNSFLSHIPFTFFPSLFSLDHLPLTSPPPFSHTSFPLTFFLLSFITFWLLVFPPRSSPQPSPSLPSTSLPSFSHSSLPCTT